MGMNFSMCILLHEKSRQSTRRSSDNGLYHYSRHEVRGCFGVLHSTANFKFHPLHNSCFVGESVSLSEKLPGRTESSSLISGSLMPFDDFLHLKDHEIIRPLATEINITLT